jgi:ketosteroid isomerase-like protein
MIGAIMARRAIRSVFSALSGHDLTAFVSQLSDDCTFVYPGNITPSGTYQGKPAVEAWFRRFFEQYPTIEFNLRDICLRNAFDFVGNNVIAVHWDLHVVSREGVEARNIGVTIITVRRKKAVHLREMLFDQDGNWRRCWGAA